MNKEFLEHYYGDSIRVLFIIGGLIMLATYPFFSSFIGAPIPFAIIGCITLAVLGGLMNPRQKWVISGSAIISVLAFVCFEYYAIYAYLNL